VIHWKIQYLPEWKVKMLHIIVTKVLSEHYPTGDIDLEKGEACCNCGEQVPVINDDPATIRLSFIKHAADMIYKIVGDHISFASSLLDEGEYDAVRRQLNWIYGQH